MIKALFEYNESNFDGTWEHSQGLTIKSTDNPGWLVELDLKGARREAQFTYHIGDFPSSRNGNLGSGDWLHCQVVNGQFIGAASRGMLKEIDVAFALFMSKA